MTIEEQIKTRIEELEREAEKILCGYQTAIAELKRILSLQQPPPLKETKETKKIKKTGNENVSL